MHEYRYVVNVEGAVVQDGEYLLVERAATEDHAAGSLGFPGGKVEVSPGTDAAIEATARRELAEEVGVTVGDVEYVLSRSFEADTGTPCLNIVTHCTIERGTPTPEAPSEVAAIHWLSPAAIDDHGAAPPYLERYVDAIEAHRNR